ncbi:mitochondrial import inner membrane translocase subunit tim54 [Mortierella polycephala]|uniref:Mitochondrial import inner membrane translocase subunit TIM54 n=1 Tax=Mortierella polycephala TaxID=41804 RepID=A0A9P6QDV7_9FUNG|nr:mitochondrial import inner membrane translocase subunit tim54 [Mortierella polycephala]
MENKAANAVTGTTTTTTTTTEARPKLTPAAAPTTLSGKLRAKLPGRGWMIFWGTIGTIGGLVYRDHVLTVEAKKRVAAKVDVLAKQTCGVQDMPRKITVYIMAPPGDGIHKTRHYFKQFIKPVFDAAALDYEVREGLAEGQIQSMVAADVRKKRQVAAGKASALKEAETNAPVTPLKSISDGVVVLGRIALAEVLQGYNDGCLQSLDDPEPAAAVSEMVEEAEISPKDEAALLATETTGSVETTMESDKMTASETEPTTTESTLSTSASTEPAKEAEATATTTPAPAPEPVKIPQDESYFSVPPSGLEPVGYIPFKNLTGFRNMHKKIFALFNSYDCVEYAGGAVMKIAFAETKDMEPSDLEIGKDEEPLFKKYRGPVDIQLLDKVREQVKLFVTPENIPEAKKADSEEEF